MKIKFNRKLYFEERGRNFWEVAYQYGGNFLVAGSRGMRAFLLEVWAPAGRKNSAEQGQLFSLPPLEPMW